jgi:hypothetical protein
MAMPESEQRRNRVCAITDQINRLLAGLPVAEAQTTLTLSIIISVCTTGNPTREERVKAADGFARQVREFAARDDIAEWIRHSVVSPSDLTTREQ